MTDRPELSERTDDVRDDERPSAPVSLREDAPSADHKGGRDQAARRPTEPKQPARSRSRSPRPLIAIALIVLGVAAGGLWYWWSGRDLESTDDAYTDGRAVSVAPHVSGYVTALFVNDNQRVRQGEVLALIDTSDFQAARDQAASTLHMAEAELENARITLETQRITAPARLAAARAQRDTAQATLANAQAEFNRQHSVPRAATTQQAIDTSTATFRTAQAQLAQAEANVRENDVVEQTIAQAEAQVHQLEGQVAQARAQLAQAELNLGWTKITAPQEGWITQRRIEVGNLVQTGSPVFSIVTPEVWITANFKESQLNRMRAGDRVDITVDGYPGLALKGHVDSIQLGSGAEFSAFPAENATGNFVKIVRRVPVKIVIDQGLAPERPLPLGISVEPTVHLK